MTTRNPDQAAVEDGRRSIIYIDSKLDDYGLTTRQFRVYCHLARRASGMGREAWPSVASIAKVCRMREDAARESLAELVSMGLLRFRDNPGKTRIYTLTDSSEWSSQNCESGNNPSGFGGAPRNNPSAFGGAHPSPGFGGDPSALGGDEGNPLKVIQEGNPFVAGNPPATVIVKPTSLKTTPRKAEGTPGSAAPLKKQFSPPSVDECVAYADSIGLPCLEAEKFVNYHESKGWVVGNSPMKSWQAAMRTWKLNWQSRMSERLSGNTPPKPKPVWLQIKELEARIESHVANHNRLGYDSTKATPEAKEEWKRLKQTLKDLQAGQTQAEEGAIP